MKYLLLVLLLFFGTAYVQVMGQEISDSPEQCVLPKKTGPCRASLPRYYFNAVTETCEMFIYGGCGTLGNCMTKKEDCERICTEAMKAKALEANGLNFACSLPQTNGVQCTAGDIAEESVMWFYDQGTATCRTFTYKGCGGNQNQFASEKDCRKICISENAGDDSENMENKEKENGEESQKIRRNGKNKVKRQNKKAKKLAKKMRSVAEEVLTAPNYDLVNIDEAPKVAKRQNKKAKRLAKNKNQMQRKHVASENGPIKSTGQGKKLSRKAQKLAEKM